jgi:hypothetical protein
MKEGKGNNEERLIEGSSYEEGIVKLKTGKKLKK